jgi:NitT/TauT family transport system ATP-binding protein
MIEFANIEKRYPTNNSKNEDILALDNISFRVEAGELVVLLGPSGCGKSTLLSILAGFEQISAGSLQIDPQLRRVMMFQEPGLFPWLSALGNVEFSLKGVAKAWGLSKINQRQLALQALEQVRLSDFAQAQPHQLSGGMKSRVALARSLVLKPEILLMDEPFAALDAQTRDAMHLELLRLWRETGTTILFVTHNLHEAVQLATRVLVFSARPGRIKREFDLRALHSRSLNDPAVIDVINQIEAELHVEIEKNTH